MNLSLSPSARRMKGRRRKDHGECGRRTGGLFGREKDTRRGRGGRVKERERDEERLTSREKEGENVDGMETREGGGVARIEGDGARVERLDGIPIRAKSAGHYTGSVGIATS